MRHSSLFLACFLVAVPLVVSRGQDSVGLAQDSVVHPDRWPTARSPIGLDDAIETRIGELIGKMTLRQKVGQVIQADIGSIQPDDLKTYPLGSILNGGNSAPGGNNRAAAKDWLLLADAFYNASRECDLQGGPFIPLLWGTDAVHGHNNIVGATYFPHNIGLGATRNPALLRKIGEITAREIRVTGQEWTFAPTIAVVRDDRWGRTYEGYAEHPEVTASYTGELIEGIQGVAGDPSFLQGEHVIATAKHFVGDGGTTGGKDQGNNQMSEEDLRDLQAAGYPVAINHGVQCVMASFSEWQGKRLHGHKGLLTDVLKGRMGFDGFIVGDWNAHAQVPGCTATDALPVLEAGLDMYMAADSWRGLFETMLRQAESGDVDMARLDDAVRRILRVKLRAGLFEADSPSSRPLAGKFDELGKPEHRAVARQAVRESLVLLKNNGGVLPLRPNATIVVAGDGADNIGKQSGGWTLSWQGTGNSNDDFPGGTSIYEGIRRQVRAAGGRAILVGDGKPVADSSAMKPAAAIIVFGEDPYAEFQGDVETLAYKPGDDKDYRLLKSYSDRGVPTIAVFLTGRPLWVNREINASDAFVAAWLPGSEGIGVADVLLADRQGQVQYDFKGKLSYSWPRTPMQTPLNVGQAEYDPLFAYGYGLTYSDSTTLPQLSEQASGGETALNLTRYFDRGRAIPPWRIVLASEAERMVLTETRGGTANDAIRVVSADESAQEDIRTITWTGKGQASFALAAENPVDLSAPEFASASIKIRLRVDTPPSSDVTFALATSGGSKSVSLGERISGQQPGVWQELSVPVANLGTGDALKSVTAAMVIQTSGTFKMSLAKVQLDLL
ncbi:exo 1,3/1,4-beta-D-glucan glucohydrolase [Stieleria sp. ICT_E10.1]|uniref:glycoside hydrolase family 3 protein n=1 Tax=Stieleria sedimenti TaxID=2976331 RepID=UPI00217FE13A|nr:glycoside hydrolase family 3 protein [Stieleria sedimenti]MCS7469707.1 exo 1,3/1,4-beta-D-glucan glucohydrolase [Stieleria sedimenti]